MYVPQGGVNCKFKDMVYVVSSQAHGSRDGNCTPSPLANTISTEMRLLITKKSNLLITYWPTNNLNDQATSQQ